MDKVQKEPVGAADMAERNAGKYDLSRLAPGYERPLMVHKVPKRPIRLDGDRREPTIVQKFDGKPLYWVLDKEARDGKEISVFTRPEDAKDFRSSLRIETEKAQQMDSEIGVSAQALTAGVNLGGYVELFENSNYGGAKWTFWTSWGNIPDFTRVYPTLWWTTNINDRVSAFDSYINANPPDVTPWTVLYEHINYAGSQLWIPDQYWVDDLGAYGWNDIASSLTYEA